MKKLASLIMLIFFAGFSCQEKAEEPIVEACGVQNPVKELTWLTEKTSSYESSEINSFFISLKPVTMEKLFLY